MAKELRHLALDVYSRLDLSSEKALSLRDMNLSIKEYGQRWKQTEFTSEPSLRLLKFLAEYDDGFYCPEKCDLNEPIIKTFDPNNLSPPVRWLSQPFGRVMVKKAKPFRYEGFVENCRFSNLWERGVSQPLPRGPDPVFLTEWCLWLRTKLLKLKSLQDVRHFFIDLYLVSEGDYGFLTMEQDHKDKNYLVRRVRGGTSSQFVGDNLEKCLPGVYWGNIFGSLYVDWFGRDKFDTLPCYYKEELADGSYYVQSSDDLDYFEKPHSINFVEQITDHLGRDAFFDIRDPFRRCKVPPYIEQHRRGDDTPVM